jgi:cytochrome c oxidase assembly protein subunit 15
LLLVAMVGSWASLSNTLHPSSDLWTGFAKDFADESHYLVKLRFLHPLLASLFCIVIIYWKINSYMDKDRTQDLLLGLGFLIAFVFGWLTLLFLAPVWMKLVHLTFAHCLWALIISSIFDLSSQAEPKTQSGR